MLLSMRHFKSARCNVMSRCSSVEAQDVSKVEHDEMISLRLRGSVEISSFSKPQLCGDI